MATAFIGLGSNLGDRAAHIGAALDALELHPEIVVRRRSRLRETEPVGGPPQGPYLNGAAEIETSLSPADLLAVLLTVERDRGRRPGPRWGPREIDLDLLLYDDLVLREGGLEVPHPRLAERAFVLEPLAEIAPDRVHPIRGRTVRDLWRRWSASRSEKPTCE